jgi:hypothetical protein
MRLVPRVFILPSPPSFMTKLLSLHTCELGNPTLLENPEPRKLPVYQVLARVTISRTRDFRDHPLLITLFIP